MKDRVVVISGKEFFYMLKFAKKGISSYRKDTSKNRVPMPSKLVEVVLKKLDSKINTDDKISITIKK